MCIGFIGRPEIWAGVFGYVERHRTGISLEWEYFESLAKLYLTVSYKPIRGNEL